LVKNDKGEVAETPSDMFWRVAKEVASAEKFFGATDEEVTNWANEFYRLMATGKFEPNTPTLINAGRGNGLAYSACFVLPISDSLVKGRDSIYRTLADMAAIHQSGGGTGFSFSNLRPSGWIVNSTSGVASGPISFMSLYDSSTDVVKQGGTRRGANMGIMRVDHPDILEFIHCKNDTSKITNFNISVAVTRDFMNAVLAKQDYPLVDPTTGNTTSWLSAKKVFDEIVTQAHATGEPGLFFIDEANEYNPVPHLGSYEATNPCGEQPLLPYDVCNLGSINVGAYVVDGKINWDDLDKDIHATVRFLDNVIDVNQYPLPEIRDLSNKIRRIGLGIMGWADMLVRLGISYGSPESFDLAEKLMQFLQEKSYDASEDIALQKGEFPEWDYSIWGPDDTCARNHNDMRIKPEREMRNCNLTTVAPTGSISMIANCSGGIEPLFAIAFTRRQAGLTLQDVNEDFVSIAKKEGWYSEELIEEVIKTGSVEVEGVPEKWKKVFVTSHDVSPRQHVVMQASFQKYCDSAISKTINLPQEATVNDVAESYLGAHFLKCKGITVYRDGSRPDQVLSTTSEAPLEPVRKKPHRPETVFGFTRRIKFAHLGKVYITVNSDLETGQPIETFIQLGKAGSDENSVTEALARLISLGLKEGIAPEEVAGQLRGIGGKTFVFHNGKTFSSIPDAVGDTLLMALSRASEEPNEKISEEPPSEPVNQLRLFGASCPDCGSKILFEEGCQKCSSCGYSAC
jgi:ribonucleoside-diphosphate reductase alpha chain